jgi:hypothetical protein
MEPSAGSIGVDVTSATGATVGAGARAAVATGSVVAGGAGNYPCTRAAHAGGGFESTGDLSYGRTVGVQ